MLSVLTLAKKIWNCNRWWGLQQLFWGAKNKIKIELFRFSSSAKIYCHKNKLLFRCCCFSENLFIKELENIWIYNLNSVPQNYSVFISRRDNFEQTRVVVARNKREALVEVKNNKTMLTILSFIQFLYLNIKAIFFGAFAV